MRILQRFVKGVGNHYADMLDVVHCLKYMPLPFTPELCLLFCLSKNVKIRMHRTIILPLVLYDCGT
jgi:hypothetical protein